MKDNVDAPRQAKKSLEKTIHQAPAAFSLFDCDGFLIQVNDAWASQWQISPEIFESEEDKFTKFETIEVSTLVVLWIGKSLPALAPL